MARPDQIHAIVGQRVADQLNAIAPDIVLLQEVFNSRHKAILENEPAKYYEFIDMEKMLRGPNYPVIG